MVGGDNKGEKPEEQGICLSLLAIGATGVAIGGTMLGGIAAAKASR